MSAQIGMSRAKVLKEQSIVVVVEHNNIALTRFDKAIILAANWWWSRRWRWCWWNVPSGARGFTT
eukprot:SAG31_NODE_13513_length_864_cov_1.154248_2_plen_65_part_00